MARNITFSIVILVPVLGIGSWIGFGSRIDQTEAASANAIQPLEMHRALDHSTLRDQEISSLF